MASDYKKIAEEHEKRYGWDAKPRRIYKRLYNDKTHFVYELIQNADDSGSDCLELQLNSNTLLVWNDGRQFTEKDVRNICSLGSSDKDLTDIGAFGIGFKAVYNYTEFPEIYSNDERFRIRDFIKPEGIDEITPEIVKLVDEGKTVFRLPFKNNLPQDDLEHLKNRLCDLSKERSLLFLRCLKRVEWKDERNGQVGSYSCHRHPYEKIQDVPENESIELVKLRGSLNGKSESSETFLAFYKNVHPPKDVIDQLLEQAEDEEEQQRIQQSAEEPQPIEVAFKLRDDRITPMDDNCVLFAYLPTQKETHLKFLIQARYQTTPARDNIPKPSENPWNRWLVRETADFLPEILEQLRSGGLLEPAFFNVLPLKGEVENEFKPIAEALQKAMQERAFVPTQSGGYATAGSVFHVNSKGVTISRGIEYKYAKARNVYYPHTEILRQLIENNGFHPESSWLHPEIRDTGEFHQCFTVMQEAGVKPMGVSRVLGWLEERDSDWFKKRSNKWLCFLYTYLKEQGLQLDRIKKLPLVRLENGQHVCASIRLVFFPPDTDEGCEEIEPFISEMPILQSTLLEEDEHDNIKKFLKNIGVREPHPKDMIRKWIIPQYSQSNKPSVEVGQNYQHVRYLFKVWDRLSGYEHKSLREEISETPILWTYNGIQPETFDFVKPCDAYLPQAYTGDMNLDTYFSVITGNIWFVDGGYLEGNSNPKEWFKFLKAIKAMDMPQVIKKNIPADDKNAQEFDKELDNRNIKGQSKRSTWLLQTNIEDSYLHGLSELLDEISKDKKVNLSQALWCLLVKVLPSERKKRDSLFQGTYHRFYYSNRSDPFDATFYRQLKETPWLPDDQGNLHLPSECFAPTSENRGVLGDSVAYLHPDFNISTEPAQWLAKKLDIFLKPDTESVLNYLEVLSNDTKASVEKVEPLYRFLERQDARRSEEFKQKRLIFTSNPEPRWWKSDEVFWEDESEVFGNHRGYLKAHYPTLETFFSVLGVSKQASQMHYARRIQEIATTEQAEDEKVRERVRKLYECLQTGYRRKWEIIYGDRCWLGKKGEEWGFSTRQELVLKDHPHIGEIFEGKVPFWTFDDDLSSFTKTLNIEGCSQAQVQFQSEGDQEEDTDWSKKVRNLHPYIYAFLNSPRLSEESNELDIFTDEEPEEEKLAGVLDQLSVCRVKELKVTYKLKGVSVTDPNPRQSFLDEQQAKLWLGLEVNESEYAELIGDALQDHFGIKELGRFVEDLLTPRKKQDRVLSNWKRKGLETKFLNEYPKDDEKKRIESLEEPNSGNTDPTTDESDMRIPTDNETPKTDGEDNDSLTADESETYFSRSEDDDSRTDGAGIETLVNSETSEMDESDDDSLSDESKNYANLASDVKDISSPDTQSSTKTGSGITQNVNGESKSETPTVHENPETGNENDDSTGNESKTPTYQPLPGRSGTTQPGGHSISTSTNRKRGGGGHGGHGGGGEGEEHENLKRDLANNPSQFGEGLELVKIEYTFGSGDRVDILLKDGSENPVTVEVETGFSSGSGRYVGVWQAVKYQHLAAMKYNLVCKQVRSILAAPEIPDDVKEKCKELGIEPFEVPQE